MGNGHPHCVGSKPVQVNRQEPHMQGERSPWALPTEPVPAPAQSGPVSAPAAPPAELAKPAQTPAKPAQPPVKPVPHSAPAALTPSKMPDAQQLLDRLKEDILKKGNLPHHPSLFSLVYSGRQVLHPCCGHTTCSKTQLCGVVAAGYTSLAEVAV